MPGLGVFLTGWVSLLGLIGAGAILALASAAYLVAVLEIIFPAFAFPPRLIAIPVVLLVTLANFQGVRLGRRLQSYLVVGVAGLLLLLAAASGWHRLPAQNATPTLATGSWLIGVGALIASLWSVEVLVGIREEIRRPHYNVPRALFSAPIVAGLLGAVVTLSASRWTRTTGLLPATAAIAEWAGFVGGPAARWLACVIGILFSGLALNRLAVTAVRQRCTPRARKAICPPD